METRLVANVSASRPFADERTADDSDVRVADVVDALARVP
jgi:hypothetical protein